jgi:CubicO group peptidase (beta-lactamase class C family)
MTRFKTLLAAVLLAGACAGITAFAQAPAVDPVPKMKELVQGYADSKVMQNEFMGTVLVAQGDKVLLSQGYGSANLEWNIPNTPDAKFRLGSLTKQFTAASILLLEERGKLSTDDLVKKYVPDAPAAWDKMTIYQVLTHTAGIPNFTAFPDYRTNEWENAKPVELVARFKDKPLDFEPGTEFRYSNSGYVLLGYILEQVSGEPYAKFVQENLFTPLGMADTGVDRSNVVLSKRAEGYEPHSNGGHNVAGYINMSIPFSAGSLYSTTGDLLKWEQGLFGGKLLKPESLKKMTTPYQSNYACGLEIMTFLGHKEIMHGGGIEGFSTSLAYFPDEKAGPLTVVVLSNAQSNVDQIAQNLARVMFGLPVKLPRTSLPTEVTLPDKLLADFVGTYQLAPTFAIKIAVDGGHLTAQGTGQPAAPIFAESETRFFAKVVDAEFEFTRDASGKVVSMTLFQNGNEIKGPKN